MIGASREPDAQPRGGVAWLNVSAGPAEGSGARLLTGPLGLQLAPLAVPGTRYYFQGGRLRGARCIWAASTVAGARLARAARSAPTAGEPAVHLLARAAATGSVLEHQTSVPSTGVLRVIDPSAAVSEQFEDNTHAFTLNVPLACVAMEPVLVTEMFGRTYPLSPLQEQLLRSAVALLVYGPAELRTPEQLDGVDCYLAALATLLLRTAGRRPSAGSAVEVGPETLLRARVDAIISEQAADPLLTPGVIAAQLNTSLRQLYRAFAGTDSPAARIRHYRLAHAADVLTAQATRPPVDQIARECGFTSAEYFSRAFRREFGVSPRAYRSAPRDRSVDS
jgi:AraC-like DNA-binding protein